MTKFALMSLEIISAIAGVLLVLLTSRDVFQTVVVPRAPFANLRPSTVLTRVLWAFWPQVTRLYRSAQRREDVLGAFAPFDMIALLVLWASLLGLGYGLLFFSIHDHLGPGPIGLLGAIYFAYTTMLTIGFGDIVPHTILARALAIMDGASGLGLVAVVTSYLFSIFGSFAARERYVIELGARAGTPPSGSALLETHGYAKLIDALPNVFHDGQAWAAALVQSQTAYPVLSFFRSNEIHQSWVLTLGLLLDAATLVVTTVDGLPKGEAELLLAVGRNAAHKLSAHHRIGTHRDAGSTRDHFTRHCARLHASGYTLRDPEAAWHDYTRLRATYGPELNAIAHYFRIPSLPWSDSAD